MQEEGCLQHESGANFQVESKSTCDDENFEDWDYEVMMRHEDCVKVEGETKKEL